MPSTPQTKAIHSPLGSYRHRTLHDSHVFTACTPTQHSTPMRAHVLALSGGNVSYGAWGTVPAQFAAQGIATDVLVFSGFGNKLTHPRGGGGLRQARAHRVHWRSSMNAAVRARVAEIRRDSTAPIFLAGFSMGAVHSIGMLARGKVHALDLAGVILLAPALWFHAVERVPRPMQWLVRRIYAPGMAALGARKDLRVRHIAPQLRPHLGAVQNAPFTHLYAQMRYVEETREWWLQSTQALTTPTLIAHGGDSERICHPRTIEALRQRLPNAIELNLDRYCPGHYLLLNPSAEARAAVFASMVKFISGSL